ncbi:Lysosome-associated membrane glycoprotein 5 [Acipenser ruthenus]|uniref:Lysosome-associated membrane glycoprotein 5 n=1 Tax=Acipenser ruthenus TaxID=7906 RepID=A0A444U167_ACIRT|nr:Lysosome-associated membrane glycoprotein 5 [Acipenser ruthenus]
MDLNRFKPMDSTRVLFCVFSILAQILAEQEVENLSGLSTSPDKDIFVVRENGTTCLMAEFVVRIVVPFDVLALNGIDEAHNVSKGQDVFWKINKIQFVYDTKEPSHFINAVNPGKHTASSHHLSALVTPGGRSYECQAQQTLSLISSDHHKGVTISMSEVRIQPFDIKSDFMFSEAYKCITDQREQLEEMLPLILGIILALIIVITLAVYHIHQKMTANQVQLPRDRSQYKNM